MADGVLAGRFKRRRSPRRRFAQPRRAAACPSCAALDAPPPEGNNGAPWTGRANSSRSPPPGQARAPSWLGRWQRSQSARPRHRHRPRRQGDRALPALVRLLPRARRAAHDDGPAARSSSRSLAPRPSPSRRMPSVDVVDLSRLQFAVTALYHFLFVPLTLGLSWILVIMESVYVMTGKRDLPRHDEVLGQALRHQLRDGRHHRDHDGIPVRHELGVLLALRRRHLRRAAGARRPDGVLPRVDVRRPVLLRLGPARQGPAPRA